MAKIEIRFSYTCAKDIFHEKGKDERNQRERKRMKSCIDDKDNRIDA